jgi:hypothetical protein
VHMARDYDDTQLFNMLTAACVCCFLAAVYLVVSKMLWSKGQRRNPLPETATGRWRLNIYRSTALPCGHAKSPRGPAAHGVPGNGTHFPIPKPDGEHEWARTQPRRLWLFWFGRALTGNRLAAYQSIKSAYGEQLHVRLVTDKDLAALELRGHPFHPGLPLLTAVHKSDYLSAYLAHHYGGG